jgi:dephospho-CoA kinase
MFLVGLTGGIASGKSTISSLLAAKGAFIIDADRIGHQVIAKGREGWKKLVEAFGGSILDEDGEVDRSKLAALVFGDKEKVAQLNAITHPLIIAEIFNRLRKCQEEGGEEAVAVLDAPLLIEAGGKDLVDLLVVVSAPEELQVERLMKDRRMTPEEAKKRISAQAPLEEKERLADYVIDNCGSLEDLREKVELLWEEIEKRSREKR